MVHVHAQGPPRAADILADAQVMQQTEEKIQEINAIDGLFVFPLQRQVGRTGRREEGPPPWNDEMMNSSTNNFFPMHVTNFYLHGTVRPVPIPTVCLQLNSLFLYFIAIVHVRMYILHCTAANLQKNKTFYSITSSLLWTFHGHFSAIVTNRRLI